MEIKSVELAQKAFGHLLAASNALEELSRVQRDIKGFLFATNVPLRSLDQWMDHQGIEKKVIDTISFRGKH